MLRFLAKIYRAGGKIRDEADKPKDGYVYQEGDPVWLAPKELDKLQPYAPVFAGFGYTELFLRLLGREPVEKRFSY